MGTCWGCGQGKHVDFSRFRVPCDCCRLVSGDNTAKPCAICEKCNVKDGKIHRHPYICDKCWDNWPKRILAFGIEACRNAGIFKKV